jgi:hypothetical protein
MGSCVRRDDTSRSQSHIPVWPISVVLADIGCATLMLRRRLLMVLLLFLLPGAVTAVEATGGCTEHAMMPGKMTGSAADRRTLEATLGVGGMAREHQRCGGEQNGDHLHGGNPFGSAASR